MFKTFVGLSQWKADGELSIADFDCTRIERQSESVKIKFQFRQHHYF